MSEKDKVLTQEDKDWLNFDEEDCDWEWEDAELVLEIEKEAK